MGKGEFLVVESALVALYLRGAPHSFRLKRRNWGAVRDALCSANPDMNRVGEALRDSGLWDEALALESPGLIDWASDLVFEGCVVTVLNASYPTRWLDVLGSAAPPCCWKLGPLPVSQSVSVVGNRVLSTADRAFARSLGAEVVSHGWSVITGGAPGADSSAVKGAISVGGADRVLILLPCGIKRVEPIDGVNYLSVCEPDAPFSGGQAMERNTLIYAASLLSLVVRARYQTGGTWTGATEALRRRTTLVGVRDVPCDKAAATLQRLGAVGFKHVGQLPDLYRRAKLEAGSLTLDFDQTG